MSSAWPSPTTPRVRTFTQSDIFGRSRIAGLRRAGNSSASRLPRSRMSPCAESGDAHPVAERCDLIGRALALDVLPLSRNRANTGVSLASAFSNPICV